MDDLIGVSEMEMSDADHGHVGDDKQAEPVAEPNP